ncbi:hypothetical protein RCL_jg27314.t1 [Rhizophagus clarus]|uniref:HTH CENPB-type domain-containing protein n=1 Tax=Rhizophagus clarus TaxID=94130 RepID=A0A8H3LVS2_9GLOM|nr:hypothetical protein RCL_jg27314.t1 [Rhizophagus clarus]
MTEEEDEFNRDLSTNNERDRVYQLVKNLYNALKTNLYIPDDNEDRNSVENDDSGLFSDLEGKKKVNSRCFSNKEKSCSNTCTKRQLCLDYQKMPRPTQEELATLYKIEKSTHFSQIEEVLSLWTTNALAADLIINTDILREKAKFFAQGFEINDFTASNGWINLKNVII